MAAGVFTTYLSNRDRISINDLLAATVKVMLLSSAYTFDAAHDEVADVSGDEITAAFGYSAGGVTLASKVATPLASGFKFVSANLTWTASGGDIDAWRHAVMYVSGSLWGRTSPLVGVFLGDTTPADVPATPDGTPLVIVCPASGWFDLVQ